MPNLLWHGYLIAGGGGLRSLCCDLQTFPISTPVTIFNYLSSLFFQPENQQNKLARRLSYIFVGNEIHNSMVGREIGNMGGIYKNRKVHLVEKMLFRITVFLLEEFIICRSDKNVSQPRDQKSDESIWNRRVRLCKNKHRLLLYTLILNRIFWEYFDRW